MTGQLDFDWEAAAARRDDGMRRAAKHADDDEPGWTYAAVAFVQRFAATATAPFLAEDVVSAAIGVLPPPPDGRAWGAVFNVASRRKIIRRVGYGPARTSNCSPKPLWSAAS